MTVMEAIRNRRSIRSYRPDPVPEETLLAVLEAGRLAPSANNRQEWRYVVVRDPETRHDLMVAANRQRFVGEAPVVIACCAETDHRVMRCGQPAYPIDVAISIDHMTLAAHELGLGTCWIGSFDADRVRRILGIPDGIEIVELLTLGCPAAAETPRGRLRLDEIVSYDRWDGERPAGGAFPS